MKLLGLSTVGSAFGNYVFFSYTVSMSKATPCPIPFKIVQHFDTDINSESLKSSYSSFKSHPDQFHLAFFVLPSNIFFESLSTFSYLCGTAELTETKQKLNLDHFHFCSSSFHFH